MNETKDTTEPLESRPWRQVEEGLDEARLLLSREKHARDLAKKLDREFDKNGWRMFVSNAAHTLAHGKAQQRRNTQI